MYLRRMILGLAIIVLTLFLSATVAIAQSEQLLIVDTPAAGILDSDTPAQGYSLVAAGGDSLSLVATSADGLPMGLAVMDGQANIIAQAADGDATGSVALTDVVIEQDGAYVVVVFALSVGDNAGSFILTLTTTDDETGDTGTTVTSPALIAPPEEILFTGGIQVSLDWEGTADLNLQVRDPVGRTLYWDSRQTSNGGAFGFDANGLCEVLATSPTETANWAPGFLSTGSYEILVFYRQACDAANPMPFTVNVTVNGVSAGTIQGTLLPPAPNQESVHLANFVVDSDGNTAVNQGGVYPTASINLLPVPLEEIVDMAQPIERDVPQQGIISSSQPYLSYSFEGSANEIVSMDMVADSGFSLDTLMQVVDSTGNVIDVNDDAPLTTNSSISNLRLLKNDTYYIVATRYGKGFGGTEGSFTITLTGPAVNVPAEVLNLDLPGGDVSATLVWNTNADLQLLVRDPVGDSVFDDNPFVTSGGILQLNGNVNCTGLVDVGQRPVSYIYWPTGFLRAGSYEVEVWFQNDCGDVRPVEFTLSIVVNGEIISIDRQLPLPGQRFVTNFNIDPTAGVTSGQSGFVGGSETVAYQSEMASAIPIISGQPASGLISPENTFDLYTFSGLVGETVSINMNTTSLTLDANLFLIAPSGVEIAANDDGDPVLLGTTGRTTDALVNEVTLPENGVYTIIATRFATVFGGTVGSYNLTLRKN